MNMLFSPPVLFAFFLVLFALIMHYLKRYEAKSNKDRDSLDPYACGQKGFDSYVNPNYKQFFKFAFLFTVLHVLVLVVTTAPRSALLLPLAYVAVGGLTLAIIFRK